MIIWNTFQFITEIIYILCGPYTIQLSCQLSRLLLKSNRVWLCQLSSLAVVELVNIKSIGFDLCVSNQLNWKTRLTTECNRANSHIWRHYRKCTPTAIFCKVEKISIESYLSKSFAKFRICENCNIAYFIEFMQYCVFLRLDKLKNDILRNFFGIFNLFIIFPKWFQI